MMKPVRVSVDVPQPRERVYDFLDVMANHEPFTNHVLRNWQYSGPESGIGSRATVEVKAAGRTDNVEIEVIAGERPETIVEQNRGAGGRRVATGTYTLAQLPAGGTRIVFEYAWQEAPLGERLAAPLLRRFLTRVNRRAMVRLATELASRQTTPVAGGVPASTSADRSR